MDGKYGHFIKELPFTAGGAKFFKRSFVVDKSFLGIDNIFIRFGTCDKQGAVIEETEEMHTHDYDQVLFFFSSDLDDMLELRAEIEVAIGEEGDRFRFTIPTAVSIPRGVPHFPAVVRKLDREVSFLAISCSSECRATPFKTELAPDAGQWGTGRSQYKKNVMPMHFMRKDGYIYGSEVQWDSGGTHTSYSGERLRTGVDVIVAWQSIRKAHTMGPRTPDLKPEPHLHQDNELLLFLGMDSDDPGYLGGEAEFSYGPENELHKISRSSVALFPKEMPHSAVTYQEPEKPYILVLVFPEGSKYTG